jgi:hypothetical protein
MKFEIAVSASRNPPFSVTIGPGPRFYAVLLTPVVRYDGTVDAIEPVGGSTEEEAVARLKAILVQRLADFREAGGKLLTLNIEEPTADDVLDSGECLKRC